MAEEIITQETQEPDYVQAIADLKANSVNKAQYEKLKEENARLVKAMINGDEMAAEAVEDKPTVEDLRNKLKDFHGSDIEGWQTALNLRNAVIEEGGTDPFLPIGRQVQLTPADYASAEHVAQVIQECINMADGNNGIFLAQLKAHTNESVLDRMMK